MGPWVPGGSGAGPEETRSSASPPQSRPKSLARPHTVPLPLGAPNVFLPRACHNLCLAAQVRKVAGCCPVGVGGLQHPLSLAARAVGAGSARPSARGAQQELLFLWLPPVGGQPALSQRRGGHGLDPLLPLHREG